MLAEHNLENSHFFKSNASSYAFGDDDSQSESSPIKINVFKLLPRCESK